MRGRRPLGYLLGATLCVGGCTPYVTVQDAHLWMSGLPLPVNHADFPSSDVASGWEAEKITPTTVGSLLLRTGLAKQRKLRDFVREHGIPDGVLLTHGPHLELYYLDEDRTYVFSAKTTDIELVETKVLAGADRAALNTEAHRTRAANDLRANLDRLARVYRIARTVARAVPPQQPMGHDPGFVAMDLTPEARRLFGVADATEGVVVALVHPGGAADGLLQPGDVIAAANGRPIRSLEELHTDDRNGTLVLSAGSPARVVAIRPERVPVQLTITLVRVAPPKAIVTDDRMLISTGMLELVENDDQLAIIVGHELAHVTEGHVHLSPNKVLTGVLAAGLLIPAVAFPPAGALLANAVNDMQLRFDQDQERVADQRGIEYAARAGYDPNAAVRLLELLEHAEQRYEGLKPFSDAHPPYSERIAAARAAAVAVRQSLVVTPEVPIEQ
jgi:hypothetical protein